MDNSDSGPMNIAKIVINNQTTTEPFKSSPLKTYSKKSPDTNEAKSRYGRTQKRNFNNDFLSTDKSLSHYFNAGVVSRKFFIASNAKDAYSSNNPVKYSPQQPTEKKGRGRPRKSLPANLKLPSTETVVSQNLNTSLPSLLPDYQAPAPTSTETLPVPVELGRNTATPGEPAEECHDADWNVGDLCWACIDGWPYWPGVVTRDPTNTLFRRTKFFGRCTTPVVMLHVTFFGDNGLRSWVKINRIMTFSGLDDYQNLIAEFCGPDAKSKDPSLARMYVVAQAQMKKWQAAVSEAESLLSESRQERVKYLQNLYPTVQPSPHQQLTPASPKQRGRKRKTDSDSMSPSKSVYIRKSPPAPSPAKRQTIYSPKDANEATSESKESVLSGSGPLKVTPLKLIPVEKVPASVKPILLKGRLPGISSGNPVVIKEEASDGGEEGGVKTLIVEDGQQTYKVRLMRATDLPPRVLASVIKPERGPPITPRAIYRNDENTKKASKSSASKAASSKAPVTKVQSSTPKGVSPKVLIQTPNTLTPKVEPKQEDTTPKRGRGRPRGSSKKKPKKRLAESVSPKVKGKRGRPPKKRLRLQEDEAPLVEPKQEPVKQEIVKQEPVKQEPVKQEPVKQEVVEKVPVISNQREPRPKREIKKKNKHIKRSFQAFCDQHFDRAVEENPTLSKADVEKYLEKRWSEMSTEARAKYKSRLVNESDDSEDSSSVTEDSEDKVPLATPTVKTYRRTQHLFCGIKNDKVCQVCLKGSEAGEEVVRCRGPCTGVFHASCGEHRPPKELFVSQSSPATAITPGKKNQGPKRKPSLTPSVLDTPPHSQGSPKIKIEDVSVNGSPGKRQSKLLKKLNTEEQVDPDPLQKTVDLDQIKTEIKEEPSSSKTPDHVTEPEDVNDVKIKIDLDAAGDSSLANEVPAIAVKTEETLSEGSIKEEGKLAEDETPKVPKNRKNRKKSAEDKESSENGKEPKWMCGMCTQNKEDPCFVCCEYTSEPTYRCSIAVCGKMYHEACKDEWPQQRMNGQQAFMCPQHACHTCISDDPKAHLPKFGGDKLVRCLHCPSAFHHSNWCIPAGTVLLSMSQIICPRHYKFQSKKITQHVNTSWCQICSIGGSLICCDDCPNSFHPECLKITPPQGKYICEDCETGRYPLYGEVVWVKLGSYRWWPAKILFPSEIPDNIHKMDHEPGMFVVKFFGSHDHNWVNRGRTFLYHEGDGEEVKGRSTLDTVFNLAMKEAAVAFENQEKERSDREAGANVHHKPPKYVKITVNKLTGKVKPPYSDEVPNVCECTLEMSSPCGENSDCINRMLYVECAPDVCPAKEKCQNQKFEKKEYPPLVPFKTANRGWGLKVLVPLKKGDFVIEYVGEIIDTIEYNKRLCAKQRTKDGNYYFLNIDKDTMIDAGPKGNKARFINHSCSPNCETQKWTVNGITRIGIFTIKDIPKDSELVFNYKLETIGDTLVECKCGAEKCTGYIGGKGQTKTNGGEKKVPGEGPPRAPRVRSRGGARPRVARPRVIEKVTEDACFTCGEGGELLLCDSASCPKGYHLSCLGLTKQPPGGWVCPWHQCSVCSASKVQRCALCINSYCNQHASGNISLDTRLGVLICINHAHDSDSGSESEADNKSKGKSLGKKKAALKIEKVKVLSNKKESKIPAQPDTVQHGNKETEKSNDGQTEPVQKSSSTPGRSSRVSQASRSTPTRATRAKATDTKAAEPKNDEAHSKEKKDMKSTETNTDKKSKVSTNDINKKVGSEVDPTENALSKILGEMESTETDTNKLQKKKSEAKSVEVKRDRLSRSKQNISADKPETKVTRSRSTSDKHEDDKSTKPKVEKTASCDSKVVKSTRSRSSNYKVSADKDAASAGKFEDAINKFEELKADCKKLEEALTSDEKTDELAPDNKKADGASKMTRSRASTTTAIDKSANSKVKTPKSDKSDLKLSERSSEITEMEVPKVGSPIRATRSSISSPTKSSAHKSENEKATKTIKSAESLSLDSKNPKSGTLEETLVESIVPEEGKSKIEENSSENSPEVKSTRARRSLSRNAVQLVDKKKDEQLELKSPTHKTDDITESTPKNQTSSSNLATVVKNDLSKSEDTTVKSKVTSKPEDSKSTVNTVKEATDDSKSVLLVPKSAKKSATRTTTTNSQIDTRQSNNMTAEVTTLKEHSKASLDNAEDSSKSSSSSTEVSSKASLSTGEESSKASTVEESSKTSLSTAEESSKTSLTATEESTEIKSVSVDSEITDPIVKESELQSLTPVTKPKVVNECGFKVLPPSDSVKKVGAKTILFFKKPHVKEIAKDTDEKIAETKLSESEVNSQNGEEGDLKIDEKEDIATSTETVSVIPAGLTPVTKPKVVDEYEFNDLPTSDPVKNGDKTSLGFKKSYLREIGQDIDEKIDETKKSESEVNSQNGEEEDLKIDEKEDCAPSTETVSVIPACDNKDEKTECISQNSESDVQTAVTTVVKQVQEVAKDTDETVAETKSSESGVKTQNGKERSDLKDSEKEAETMSTEAVSEIPVSGDSKPNALDKKVVVSDKIDLKNIKNKDVPVQQTSTESNATKVKGVTLQLKTSSEMAKVTKTESVPISDSDEHMSVKRVIRSYSRSPRKIEPKPELKEPVPVMLEVPSCPSAASQSGNKSENKSSLQSGDLNIQDMIVVFDGTSEAEVTDVDTTQVTVNGH